MKPTRLLLLLLPSLLLLVSAAPATRPAVGRLIVQVRHLEFPVKPDAPAIPLGNEDQTVPQDATELSSIQVTAEVGQPFEAVAVIRGATYRLAGTVKSARGHSERFAIDVDYAESSGRPAVNLSQITSNVIARLDTPTRLGGMTGEAGGRAMVLTVRRG